MNLRHPVLVALVPSLMLVLIGIYFVERQRAVSPRNSGATWNSGAAYVDTTVTPQQNDTGTIQQEPAGTQNPATLVIPQPASSTAAKKPMPTVDGTFDYNTLLSHLQGDKTTAHDATQDTSFGQLLESFIFTPEPRLPVPAVTTPEQQALHAYGNEIGMRIKAFVAVNPNMIQTLTDQATHRTNVSMGNALRDLGNRYKALGEGILGIQNVPEQVVSAHTELGESYERLGSALSAVPDARDDQAFVAAITAYNATADRYTNAFVAMVTLFSLYNVTFDETEPGSAFSFHRN